MFMETLQKWFKQFISFSLKFSINPNKFVMETETNPKKGQDQMQTFIILHQKHINHLCSPVLWTFKHWAVIY